MNGEFVTKTKKLYLGFLEKRKCFKGTSPPHFLDSRSCGLQWASRTSMVQMGAIRRNFYSGKVAVIVTLCLMLEFVKRYCAEGFLFLDASAKFILLYWYTIYY